MTKSTQGVVLRILTILIWGAAIYLLLSNATWYLFAFVLILHVIEVPLKGYRAGIQAGYSGIYAILMTLVFGFTWWLYLSD